METIKAFTVGVHREVKKFKGLYQNTGQPQFIFMRD
jgi:hypothetical protein